MKTLRWSLLALAASPVWASYQYYLTDSLASIDTAKWSTAGAVSPSATGLAAPNSNGGSLLSQVPIPDGSSEAEVAITVTLAGSGGVYTEFLQSSPGARTGPASAGSYLAFEMQNPQFDSNKYCSANFLVLQSVQGAVSLVAAFQHSCRSGMVMRMAVHGDTVLVWPDQAQAMEFHLDGLGAGQPGIGSYSTPAGNSISQVRLGAIDRQPPAAVDALKLVASVFRKHVDLQWPAAADDANGSGVAGYWLYRDGLYLARTSSTQFIDETVNPGESHTYAVYTIDQHFNLAPAASLAVSVPVPVLTPVGSASVGIPPPGSQAAALERRPMRPDAVVTGTPPADSGGGLDPRRTGVRALGTYWGGGGEQIDVVSGNLNYSMPLITTKAGNGWGMNLRLSYNSQMWRKDSVGIWMLGRDVGYGLGWTLQAGSIVPVVSPSGPVDHYLFTDGTGAEYSLNVKTGSGLGVWTSQEGIYISFDANANSLFFPDGTGWLMGSVSSSGEQDAGTMYPTYVEDSNGNWIYIVYLPGNGSSGALYTSARIGYIWDPRNNSQPTHIFAYNGDPIPHLFSEQGIVDTAESYSFAYYSNRALFDPFGNLTPVVASLLQNVTPWNPTVPTSFGYNLSTGELTQVTALLGGVLQWAYRTFTYASGISLREVQSRYMQSQASDSLHRYFLYHDDVGDVQNNLPCHYWTVLLDEDGKAWKDWAFNTSGPALALQWGYWELQPGPGALALSNWTTLISIGYAWSQANGNQYVGFISTFMWDSSGNSVSAGTTQTLDAYGNLVQQQVDDFGSSTVTRTYNFTYLTDTNYTSRYIRNRLTLATATSSSGTITLTSRSYDSTVCGALQDPPGAPSSIPFHDSTYSTSYTYRGNPTYVTNLGTSTCFAYQTTGVMYQAQNGVGTVIATAPSASAGYSLPGVLTPNGNGNLATSFSYDSSTWAVTSMTAPNGASATTTYDSLGRPSQTTIPDGAVTNYSYTYNPNTQTATLGNRWTKTTLDGFGRVISVVQGHDSTTVSEVDTKYAPCGCSPLGKMSQVSEPYAPGGTVYWTTYAYDASGRTLSVIAPDGSATTGNGYWGNSVSVFDATGKAKAYTRDVFGNLITTIEIDPANNANYIYTYYTYDAANHLLSVSMPRSNGTQTRTFTWSGADLVSTTNPENGTVNYTYDGAHHVLTRTDAKNQQTQYTYDTYGRRTIVKHGTLSSGFQEDLRQRVTYYYDTNPFNGPFSSNAWGRLTAVSFTDEDYNMAMNYEYGYNQAGRVTAQRFQLGQANLDAAYAWDSQGRMTYLYPPQDGGAYYGYAYDAMGNLNLMYNSAPLTIASAGYNWAGQMTSLTLPLDGLTETRTYDPITLQLTRVTTAQGSSTIMDMSYGFTVGQNNGRITSSTDWVLGETVNYTYDSLNHLATAQATNSVWGNSYAYDGFGNPTAKTVTVGSAPTFSAAYDPGTNWQQGLSYDANGNVQLSGARYDVENRLTSQPAATLPSWAYDPAGKRVLQSPACCSNGSKLVDFYGLDGRRLETFQLVYDAGSNTWSPYYYSMDLYFGGKLIKSGSAQSAVATDRLGSVRANANGQRIGYFPYGEERTATPDGQEKFGTYFRDAGTGMDYADQRYYSWAAGRFATPDPSGLRSADPRNPTSWNRYLYAGDDPVNLRDPSGLDDSYCSGGEMWSDVNGGWDCVFDTDQEENTSYRGGGPVYDVGASFSTTSQPACPAGQQLIGDAGAAQCDIPLSTSAQTVLSGVYNTTGALTQVSTWSEIAGASIVAGTALVAAPLTLAGSGTVASLGSAVATGSTPVIGSLTATAAYVANSAYNVLFTDPNQYSQALQASWLAEAVVSGESIMLASPVPAAGVTSVFAQEVGFLISIGYAQIGSFLAPPVP
jgi:RHS repeat-associated protein